MKSDQEKKLFYAFMQFRKTEWHKKKIAGYNPSELKVLFTIKHGTQEKNGMKVSEISQQLHVTPPTVTQIINILEKDGLIERKIDKEDRRAVKIHLTEAGMQVTDQAKEAFSETLSGLIDYLGEEESEHLIQLLTKVYQYFSKKEG